MVLRWIKWETQSDSPALACLFEGSAVAWLGVKLLGRKLLERQKIARPEQHCNVSVVNLTQPCAQCQPREWGSRLPSAIRE